MANVHYFFKDMVTGEWRFGTPVDRDKPSIPVTRGVVGMKVDWDRKKGRPVHTWYGHSDEVKEVNDMLDKNHRDAGIAMQREVRDRYRPKLRGARTVRQRRARGPKPRSRKM